MLFLRLPPKPNFLQTRLFKKHSEDQDGTLSKCFVGNYSLVNAWALNPEGTKSWAQPTFAKTSHSITAVNKWPSSVPQKTHLTWVRAELLAGQDREDPRAGELGPSFHRRSLGQGHSSQPPQSYTRKRRAPLPVKERVWTGLTWRILTECPLCEGTRQAQQKGAAVKRRSQQGSSRQGGRPRCTGEGEGTLGVADRALHLSPHRAARRREGLQLWPGKTPQCTGLARGGGGAFRGSAHCGGPGRGTPGGQDAPRPESRGLFGSLPPRCPHVTITGVHCSGTMSLRGGEGRRVGAQERKEQQNTVLAGDAWDLELRNADAAVHTTLGSLEAWGNKVTGWQPTATCTYGSFSKYCVRSRQMRPRICP